MTKELTYEIMQNLAFVPDAFFEEVLALVKKCRTIKSGKSKTLFAETNQEVSNNVCCEPSIDFENKPFSKYDPNSSLKESLKAWRSSFSETDDSNEAVDAFLDDIHSNELYTPKENLF